MYLKTRKTKYRSITQGNRGISGIACRYNSGQATLGVGIMLKLKQQLFLLQTGTWNLNNDGNNVDQNIVW